MADKLTSKITEAAGGPRRVQTRGLTVEQQPLPDLIAADRHLRGTAAAKKGLGVRLVKLTPPGTT